MDSWQAIIGHMDVKKMMSIKRATEMERQLEKPDEMPDLTELNIMAMMEQTFNNIPQMLMEATTEVYKMLRPHDAYKTNDFWKVGRKVILGYKIEGSYSKRSRFQVRHDAQKELTALDNVFQMLDGKGVCKTNAGPLCDAIAMSETGNGETEYVKFKCYINRNLHLEFKRQDLVDKLNLIAGGGSLRQDSTKQGTASIIVTRR